MALGPHPARLPWWMAQISVLRCLLDVLASGSEQDFVLSALTRSHWPLWGIPTAAELPLALGQTSGVPGAVASHT